MKLKKIKIKKGKNNFGRSGGLSVNYYKMIQMIQITQRISFRLDGQRTSFCKENITQPTCNIWKKR